MSHLWWLSKITIIIEKFDIFSFDITELYCEYQHGDSDTRNIGQCDVTLW